MKRDLNPLFQTPAASLQRVVVTSTHHKPEGQRLARELAAMLEGRRVEVTRDIEGVLSLAECVAGVDLVVSVGGDGTLLGTARRLVGSHVPVLGVNLGKLGFLAEHNPEEVRDYLRGGVPREWRLSPKMMLQVTLNGDRGDTRYALNDAIIAQGVMTRLITINMDVDGLHATQYRADGLVVSSPVGSTAYSLSLGGPILGQGLRALVITPIAPHSLTNRPIVIDGRSRLVFEVQSAVEELALVIDGQERLELRRGDQIAITAAPTDLLLISNGKRTYYDVLRHKLAWGASPNLLEQERRRQSS